MTLTLSHVQTDKPRDARSVYLDLHTNVEINNNKQTNTSISWVLRIYL